MKYKEQDNMGYRTIYNARIEKEKFLDKYNKDADHRTLDEIVDTMTIGVADLEVQVKSLIQENQDLKEQIKILEEKLKNSDREMESVRFGYY